MSSDLLMLTQASLALSSQVHVGPATCMGTAVGGREPIMHLCSCCRAGLQVFALLGHTWEDDFIV